MPSWKKVISSGSDAALNSLNVTSGVTGSLLGTSSYAIHAITADNGGVTQLVAGSNILISPTNGVGIVTVSSTGGGSTYNTMTGSYGSFYDTGSYSIGSVTAIYSMSLSNTAIANGVYVDGSDKTKIYFTNAGVYNLQFSSQFTNTDSQNQNANVWIRQGNGTGSAIDVVDSNSMITVPNKTGTVDGDIIASWNFYISAATNDYIQVVYSGNSTHLTLSSVGAQTNPTVPRTPSTIVTAQRIDTFLSNTGSFSGSFTGILTGTASYAASASYAVTASFVTGSIFTNSNSAASASYAVTASYIKNAVSSSYATTASYWSGSITNATSASYASTASYVNILNQNVTITGSLLLTGSINVSNTASIQGVTVGRLGSNVTSIGIGYLLSTSNTGNYNVAIGTSALKSNTTGIGNIGIGYFALNANTTGTGNAIIGTNAFAKNVKSAYNTVIGYQAAFSTAPNYTNSGYNTVMGYNALYSNVSGSYNTTIGEEAAYWFQGQDDNGSGIVSADCNVFIGSQAGYGNGGAGGALYDSSTYNTVVGVQAGYNFDSGGGASSLFGFQAGYSITTGTNNTVIGNQAGGSITNGNNNTIIGSGVSDPNGDQSNVVIIGDGNGNIRWYSPANGFNHFGGTSPTAKMHITSTGATSATTSLRIENSNASASLVVLDNGNVGIGTTTPNAKLEVNGNTSISGSLNVSGSVTIRNGFNLNLSSTGGYINGYGGLPLIWDIGNNNVTFNATGADLFLGYSNTTSVILSVPCLAQSTLNVVSSITGSAARISGSGTSILTVVGSGSATPIFTVQGSQGELFSVTDSLSGSLFSVNDISGLPILEVFSDNTTLMGSYSAPALYTTTKVASSTSGVNVLYSLSTGSYDGAFVEYTIRSGSNARAGNFMAMWDNGGTVHYTDTSTTDFGSTAGFTFGASISGSNMVVSGSGTTAGWTIKAIIKAI